MEKISTEYRLDGIDECSSLLDYLTKKGFALDDCYAVVDKDGGRHGSFVEPFRGDRDMRRSFFVSGCTRLDRVVMDFMKEKESEGR